MVWSFRVSCRPARPRRRRLHGAPVASLSWTKRLSYTRMF